MNIDTFLHARSCPLRYACLFITCTATGVPGVDFIIVGARTHRGDTKYNGSRPSRGVLHTDLEGLRGPPIRSELRARARYSRSAAMMICNFARIRKKSFLLARIISSRNISLVSP